MRNDNYKVLNEIKKISSIDLKSNFRIIVKTFFGLEEILLKEMQDLGIPDPEKLNRAVSCSGNLETLYKLNYSLRTAIRVLVPIKTFTAKNEDQLYRQVSHINWSDYFSVNQTFAIESNTHSKYFKHSKYAALKTKDAIVDQFRNKYGKRPSVDIDTPEFELDLHIYQDEVTISLNSSGDSLHRRGYRLEMTRAPINEALAAGLLYLSNWSGKEALFDPMCGSGTIAIEAALIARDIYPGMLREKFGFMNWANFNEKLWLKTGDDAKRRINKSSCKIYASDIDPKAIVIAKSNAKRAGVEDLIDFKVKDFGRTEKPEEDCILILNPPYGQRLEKQDIVQFYRGIGDTLKNNFTGCDAWIISGNKEALKFVGLRPSQKYTLYNGPIESKFYKFSLYAGSKKNK